MTTGGPERRTLAPFFVKLEGKINELRGDATGRSDTAYKFASALYGRHIRLGQAKWIVAVVIALVVIWMSSFARVLPGNVGIRVNNIIGGGSPDSLGVGWYFARPGTHIYEYPVFTRTYTWTRLKTEQNQVDESSGFKDKNGLSLSADVAVSYPVDPTKAMILVQRYRTDMDQIIAGPLRNSIRSTIVERAS